MHRDEVGKISGVVAYVDRGGGEGESEGGEHLGEVGVGASGFGEANDLLEG